MVATRKGLLTFERANGGWKPAGEAAFPGSPVVNVLHDPRDGTIYAALKLGHFGPKMHRSDDGGKTWKEIASPAFPADAAGAPSVFQIWSMETGGPNQPGRIWAGAIPAGLFYSDDRGESWQLVSSFWN